MTASAGAWYRVGTVNVTNGSAAIVGVGSNWQNDVIAIAIGDAFTIDAKTWYEVIAVNGDTSITLDRGFEGSTDNGVEYAILRNTSGTILTRIAGQIAVQFNQKQLFLDELRNWLTSEDETATLTDSHGIEHVVKTVNKIQELTGTAADKDIVEAVNDTTEGRLLTTGYGGIGRTALNKSNYSDDLAVLAQSIDLSGMMMEVAVSTLNRPPMAHNSLAGVATVARGIVTILGSFPEAEQGSIYTGVYNGSSMDWRKHYDSTNSVNPIDYGIGKQAVAFTDWDTIPLDFSGFGLISFQADNTPSGISPNYTYVLFMSGGSSADSAILMAQGQSLTYKARRDSQGAWVVDGEIFNSSDVVSSNTDITPEKLLTVGYGGLGASVVPSVASPNDIAESGFRRIAASAPGIDKLPSTGFYTILNQFYGATAATQLAQKLFSYNLYFRGLSGSGWDEEWAEIFHSKNTNFNEFGGLAAGDYIGSATFRNNGAARFYRGLSGWVSAPSSISAVGTFKIITRGSDSDVITGIPASDILYSSNTSNCELIVNIANIDGTLLNPNLEYVLVTETASSKIKAVA